MTKRHPSQLLPAVADTVDHDAQRLPDLSGQHPAPAAHLLANRTWQFSRLILDVTDHALHGLKPANTTTDPHVTITFASIIESLGEALAALGTATHTLTQQAFSPGPPQIAANEPEQLNLAYARAHLITASSLLRAASTPIPDTPSQRATAAQRRTTLSPHPPTTSPAPATRRNVPPAPRPPARNHP